MSETSTDHLRSAHHRARIGRMRDVAVNLTAAVLVLAFARSTIHVYETTHRLIGAGFIAQQILVAAIFLVRRPAMAKSRNALDLAVATGGSFGGFLLRAGESAVALVPGIWVQAFGLGAWTLSYLALGRSFGLVAANRGVISRGPYRIVRHPMYLAYMVTQFGYLLQSMSVWNVVVALFTWACQITRSIREERLLGGSSGYERYRSKVTWRLVPGIW